VRRRLLVTAVLWLVGAAVLRVTLAQPERCPPVDVDGARLAVRQAAAWIERAQQRAQQRDGTYVYEYDADTGRQSGAYNVVRHAGVTMSLYQLAASGERSVLVTADRGLAYMRDNLVRRHGWAAFAPDGADPQLGATALMLDGLSQRRLATGDRRYDELMAALGRFVVAVRRGDGQLLERYDLRLDAPAPDEVSRYATGEALWGLALLHRLFPGDGWDGHARTTARFLATERDDESDFPFAPWPDQWAAYALGEMAAWPDGSGLGAPEIDYARRLAARFGLLLRTESKRRHGGLTELVLYRPARAAGLGTWVEGSTSLWRVATLDDRLADLRPAIAARVACGAGILADRQRESGGPLVRGAWFTDGSTRMDDQQHALSALLYASTVLRQDAP
jgi:hypothetical protein